MNGGTRCISGERRRKGRECLVREVCYERLIAGRLLATNSAVTHPICRKDNASTRLKGDESMASLAEWRHRHHELWMDIYIPFSEGVPDVLKLLALSMPSATLLLWGIDARLVHDSGTSECKVKFEDFGQHRQ